MQYPQFPKTWFITGTSSGFGRTMTELLLERGDRVVATVRTGGLEDLRSRHGDRVSVVALDVSDRGAVAVSVDAAFARMGRIDVIVNNAGVGLYGAAEEVEDEQIRREIDTNLIGSISVIRAALPHLRAQGGGRIVQISSEGGQTVYPGFSLYHATKWGIEGFIESVALEVEPFGIEFTIAEPGPSKTNFGRGLMLGPELDAYAETPVGVARRAFRAGSAATGAATLAGDPLKIARAIIDSVERSPAPKRLAFGAVSYERIRAALTARLAQLEAHRDIALSTDFDA